MKILVRIEQRLEGDKPFILVGEDIHWADQDSQELFAALLKVGTPRPIFGLLTSRPEPRIIKIAKELGTEIVHLEELPDGARRQLLALAHIISVFQRSWRCTTPSTRPSPSTTGSDVILRSSRTARAEVARSRRETVTGPSVMHCRAVWSSSV